MRVAAIASSQSELNSACSITLSRLVADGHEVHAIIVGKDTQPATPTREIHGNIDGSRIHFVHGFDYSTISQANADKINACIKTIDPLVVIMPHWKSTNSDRMILAKTSLVACRGIGSILMYEINNNVNFMPTIIFPSKKGIDLDNAERYESHRLVLLDEMEMV